MGDKLRWALLIVFAVLSLLFFGGGIVACDTPLGDWSGGVCRGP